MNFDSSLSSFTIVKELNPKEAIVRYKGADSYWLLYESGNRQNIVALPHDSHKYVIQAKPDKADEVIKELRKLGFINVNKCEHPDVFEIYFITTPEKYIPSDVEGYRSKPPEVYIDLIEDVIYTGAYKRGTRFDYRDGQLFPTP